MNFCHKCGSKLIEGSSFCSNCGAPETIVRPEVKKQKVVIPMKFLLLFLGVLTLVIIATTTLAILNSAAAANLDKQTAELRIEMTR